MEGGRGEGEEVGEERKGGISCLTRCSEGTCLVKGMLERRHSIRVSRFEPSAAHFEASAPLTPAQAAQCACPTVGQAGCCSNAGPIAAMLVVVIAGFSGRRAPGYNHGH